MKSSPTTLLERVIQKLGYIIDLTRIIDRNREDGIFSDRGGTIHYVFDTNVAQMFFEPFRNPYFCEIFFGAPWDDNATGDDEINAQSCLIAAEYLFSGRLPGQSADGRWYMSRLHREELNTQIEYLQKDIELVNETLRENPRFRRDSVRSLQQLNSALTFEEADRTPVLNLASRSGMSRQEVQSLAGLSDDDFERRAVEIRSREVCRALALDRVLEPRWQLERFFNDPETLNARHELEDLLNISEYPSEIFREARDWQKTLSDVLARRGIGARSEPAVRADCQTLAAISWGSREVLSSNERLVFVTGDRALLEAYRQRYLDEPRSGPFLLRPINYFAPLFNPQSARSIIDSRNYAFQALREVLEGAMLPLNLGLFNARQPDVRMKARDHFSHKVEREVEGAASLVVQFFPTFRDDSWLNKQERRLNQLVGRLRPVEVLMLEAYPHLVAARLEERKGDFITNIESAGDAVNREIVAQLMQAKRAGLRFSLPLMNEAVRELLDQIGRRKNDARVRVLLPLKLSFASDPDEYTFYAEEIETLQRASAGELEVLLRELVKSPPRIFALASMLAFSLERWKDAARYAALAASASSESLGAGSNTRAAEDHRELSYLYAVSLRFRLSAWDPAQALEFGNPLRGWLVSAADELNKCEEFYLEHGHLSRLIRTVSERASLQVSYCEWLTFGPEQLTAQQDESQQFAFEALKVVVFDLRKCSDLVDQARVRAGLEEQRGSKGSSLVLDTATLQFRLNVLGAMLVGEALGRRWNGLRDDLKELLANLPEPAEVEWEGKPHLAEAYLAATSGDLDRLMAIDVNSVTLALDRAIIRGLQAMLKGRAKFSDGTSAPESDEMMN